MKAGRRSADTTPSGNSSREASESRDADLWGCAPCAARATGRVGADVRDIPALLEAPRLRGRWPTRPRADAAGIRRDADVVPRRGLPRAPQGRHAVVESRRYVRLGRVR